MLFFHTSARTVAEFVIFLSTVFEKFLNTQKRPLSNLAERAFLKVFNS